MQPQSKIFIGIAILVVIFIGYGVSQNNQETTQSEPSNLTVETTDSTSATNQAEAGKYLAYSPEAVANSEAENIVLSFSAAWCPSCRALEKDINANLGNIPGGVEIYKVDYDTNVALRQKYGVTTQHTQVVIDKEGNLIKKWVGSNTLQQFIAKI